MLENIWLAVMGAWERVKEIYYKFFPAAALFFAILYAIGLAGSSDRGRIAVSDIPGIVMTIAFFTIAVMFYVIIVMAKTIKSLKER